uniref:Sec-independent protein translocase component TatC n=1 Tax=Eustigmatophyceae sp. Chic 10/23 P-6w TaxID=1446905 RepID=A0A3R5T8U0_9STRA|nr:Sec-independent protein translocase component TatC [Eustigmatophyceae sp. Chic 10/23 P-6w]QAA11581.1 Sec-independent protein translocase component TatC [Eustigmatophyceae sp. Chic 10/23 P-6w]
MLFKFKLDRLNSQPSKRIYLSFGDHSQEFRDRLFQIFCLVGIFLLCCLTNVRLLTIIIQQSIEGVKFFQPSPEKYLLLSLELSFYVSILLASPFIGTSALCYFLPAFMPRERKALTSLFVISAILFLAGITYANKILIPTTLTFFLSYTKELLEPLWSFEEYSRLSLILYISSVLTFQIPIIQLILSFLGIASSRLYSKVSKYILLGSTIIGAFLTPSTDPITQTILAGAIILIYGLGTILVLLLEKISVLR